MTDTITKTLQQLNITLPKPAAPAANYVPYQVHNGLIYISGQLPMKDGSIAYTGKVGDELTVDQAVDAARLCAINILAQVQAALKGFPDGLRCVKLGGFVNSGADFAEHPAVINGASNLMVEVMGETGRHTRFAVGASNLPFNASVEIDATFAID